MELKYYGMEPDTDASAVSMLDLLARSTGPIPYENDSSPERWRLVLCNGLLEAIMQNNGVDSGKNRYQSEAYLGNLVWYATELAKHESVDIKHRRHQSPYFLDGFQAFKPDVHCTPIFNLGATEPIESNKAPEQALNVATLRVVDLINPCSPNIWHNIADEDKPDLGEAVFELMIHTGANARTIDANLSRCLHNAIATAHVRNRETPDYRHFPWLDVMPSARNQNSLQDSRTVY